MTNDIDATLEERGSRYGLFTGHARITQGIKKSMRVGNWDRLADDQKECLEMIAHKVGRILNGDPNFHDSWHDIVGYTKLVADRLAPPAPCDHRFVRVLLHGGSPYDMAVQCTRCGERVDNYEVKEVMSIDKPSQLASGDIPPQECDHIGHRVTVPTGGNKFTTQCDRCGEILGADHG